MTTLTHDARRAVTVGWVLALVSAASFALSGVLGRGLMDAGWSAPAAVAVRILVGAAVLAPLAAVQLRGRWGLLRRHLPLLAVYGAVPVAGCQLAYFTAVRHVPVGVALLIEYTAPLAVVAWLWARHGQRPTRLTVLGAAIGIVGLLLVVDLAGGATSPIGVAWALVAMVGAAFFFVLSSRESDGLPGTALAAGGLLVGGLLLLLAGAVGLVPFATATAPVAYSGVTVPWWVPVALLGTVTAAMGYGCGIAATRRLGARLASFIGLSEVLNALVFAWALLGQVPTPVQLAGGALVVAGVVAVRRGEPAAPDGPVPA
ncbi:MAG TPA: DMT family transporter [Pseudonocardia sp.]|jgi:drug/metabolite transporter (DMT)-like permease